MKPPAVDNYKRTLVSSPIERATLSKNWFLASNVLAGPFSGAAQLCRRSPTSLVSGIKLLRLWHEQIVGGGGGRRSRGQSPTRISFRDRGSPGPVFKMRESVRLHVVMFPDGVISVADDL